MPCQPFASLYVQTRRIVCLVDSPNTSLPRRGPVVVRVAKFKVLQTDRQRCCCCCFDEFDMRCSIIDSGFCLNEEMI